MTTKKIKWKRPAAGYDWYWRMEGLPETRRLLRYWAKWGLLLGLPAAAYILWAGEDPIVPSTVLLFMLAGLPIVVQRLLFLERRLRNIFPQSYSVDDRGIIFRDRRIAWKIVESALIENHPEIAGVRRILIRVKGCRTPAVMEYDPDDLDESALLETLVERVHSRILLRPAQPDEDAGRLLRPAQSELQSDPDTLLRSAQLGPRVTDSSWHDLEAQ